MRIVPAGRHATTKQRHVRQERVSAHLMQIVRVRIIHVMQEHIFVQRALIALLTLIVSHPGRFALKQKDCASPGWVSVQLMKIAIHNWKNATQKVTNVLQSQGFVTVIMTAESGKTAMLLPKLALQTREGVQHLQIVSSGKIAMILLTCAVLLLVIA